MSLERTRRRVALAGTGHRGSGTWGRQLFRDLNDRLELVGLADVNSLRLAQAQRIASVWIPSADAP